MNQFARLAIIAASVPALLFPQQKADLNAIYRIKQEALQRSKVMDHLFWLTDVSGPRLTGSTGYAKAAEWCVKQLKEYGVDNAHLEKWGPFGKGWENQRLSVHMLEPSYTPLIATPMAWTPSTDGVITGEPLLAVLQSDDDLAKWKGKLKGRIVMTAAARDLNVHDKSESERYNEKQLEEMEQIEISSGRPRAMAGMPPGMNFMQMMAFRKKVQAFLREEGVALVITPSMRGDGGTIFGGQTGSRDPKDPISPPGLVLASEHYNRIARLLDKKVPVKLEVEMKNQFLEQSLDSMNVIGEIPGTGPHKDEIVMIGAHLDSWHYATGATDNAAGSAVMIEVMRILKKLNLKLDRTVRIGLWSGEENGLLGSRAYVKQVFADRETMKTTPEWDRFMAYYNIDNGTGKVRGIYLQGNDMARPLFENWLAPFKELGVTTITSRNTSGTDHQAFDGVGLPGFQFIQDPVEYDTRTHHSNMDVYDRIQRSDLMQISTVVASVVYHTANLEDKFPRKPKPEAGSGSGMMSGF